MDLVTFLAMLGLTPVQAALIAFGLASFVPWLAAVLPHPEPGSRWAYARQVLDLLAANVGQAKNLANATTPEVASAVGDAVGPAVKNAVTGAVAGAVTRAIENIAKRA